MIQCKKLRISIGSSKTNVKTISVPGIQSCSNVPKNRQNRRWRDRFEVSVNEKNETLTVKRSDCGKGWGQNLVLEASVLESKANISQNNLLDLFDFKKKILICGFPHCGTSILKSIIGHSEDVEEIKRETMKINKTTNKKFILGKCPFTFRKFFTDEYNDYIKIFIIRNPLFVFSSLNKRFKYKIPNNHNFNKYLNTIKMFIKYKNNPEKDIYTIKYEDLFEKDYSKIKEILNNIGIKFDDSIFDNTKYTNVIIPGVKLLNEKPKNIQHGKYRTWQINQPFISNNDISKLDLSYNQKNTIINNFYVLQLYPDIRNKTD